MEKHVQIAWYNSGPAWANLQTDLDRRLSIRVEKIDAIECLNHKPRDPKEERDGGMVWVNGISYSIGHDQAMALKGELRDHWEEEDKKLAERLAAIDKQKQETDKYWEGRKQQYKSKVIDNRVALGSVPLADCVDEVASKIKKQNETKQDDAQVLRLSEKLAPQFFTILAQDLKEKIGRFNTKTDNMMRYTVDPGRGIKIENLSFPLVEFAATLTSLALVCDCKTKKIYNRRLGINLSRYSVSVRRKRDEHAFLHF